MGKKLIIFLLILLVLPLVNAGFGYDNAENLGTFKQNECVNLIQTCSNCTFVNITSVVYPSSDVALADVEMTKVGTFYNYSYCQPNQSGSYIVTGFADLDGNMEVWDYTFNVNSIGVELNESKSILYIGLLALLILIFVINFVGMGMLPARNTRDEDGKLLSISYLKYFRNVLWMTGYFLFIGIVYIASNIAFAFLGEELMAKVLFMIFHIGLAAAPVVVIVWVIWMFVSMFHDKQMQNLLNRGMFKEGNL